MSARYEAMFERLATQGEGAFGAFVMLGDPDIETSLAILHALVDGGADMLEVGIPFSDPVADGPTIQAAAKRALRRKVTPGECFGILASFRERDSHTPVGILTYANIAMARGLDHFYASAARAGVDNLLVADAPAFEAEPFARSALAHGVSPVLIAAVNTPDDTLEQIAKMGRGYTYCLARSGVTGAGVDVAFGHAALFKKLSRYGAPPPILGFGISTPKHVRAALAAGAAGAISGSAIVDIVAREVDPLPALSEFVAAMKRATVPFTNHSSGRKSATER